MNCQWAGPNFSEESPCRRWTFYWILKPWSVWREPHQLHSLGKGSCLLVCLWFPTSLKKLRPHSFTAFMPLISFFYVDTLWLQNITRLWKGNCLYKANFYGVSWCLSHLCNKNALESNWTETWKQQEDRVHIEFLSMERICLMYQVYQVACWHKKYHIHTTSGWTINKNHVYTIQLGLANLIHFGSP